MTIAEMRERSNKALSGVPKDVLLVAIVVLFSTASFGLGMLAGEGQGAKGKDGGVWVEELATSSAGLLPAAAATAPRVGASAPLPMAAPGSAITPSTGKYLASKTGTKYYLPTCSSARRIKEENRVWFASVEEAQRAGLTPATHCPGL